MKAKHPPDDQHPFVMRFRDGMGKEHEGCLVARDGKIVLYSRTAFWSITLSPAEGDALWPAVRDAASHARTQSS